MQRVSSRQRFNQARGRREVMAVPFRQSECDDPSQAIDNGMDLRGPPATAFADRLFFGPPSPPAAQR